jgi:hypothetical protein
MHVPPRCYSWRAAYSLALPNTEWKGRSKVVGIIGLLVTLILIILLLRLL